MKTTLGEKLKEYREKKFPNKGLRKVEEEVGINFVYLNRIENNHLVPAKETIVKLSKKYSLTKAQEFELFQLARMSHLHPEIRKYFSDLKGAEVFFRKITKK